VVLVAEMKTAEQYMRECLQLFILDPPDSDFQRGFLEGMKVFANEAMGFKWDDPLLWGEDVQPIETRFIPRPKFTVIDGDQP
jgi:hypothetical protein